MKRFIAVLSGLLVLPAFAEVAPVYYDEISEEIVNEDVAPEADVVVEEDAVAAEETDVKTPVVPQRVSPRNTTGRAASRAVSAAPSSVGNCPDRA